jgi:hypothetical protein
MLVWTVLPLELVLAEPAAPPVYEQLDYAGVTVQVEKLSPLECRIVRLISTEPLDYLRPEVQPGVVLTYRPTAAMV